MDESQKFQNRQEFDDFLVEWDRVKNEIARLKEVEMNMRLRIAHSGFTTDAEGTNRAELGNGYELKTVINYTYKLDSDKDKVIAVSDKLPPYIADRLFKWKVDISVSEYRLLEPAHKKLVDRILTVTEGAPKVDIIPPKGKK